MALTQAELSGQMLAQLRMLDPSVSAEVGTPERKILDTVAEALADAQIDLTQLAGALDIDAKYGSALDRFLTLFGFARQQATRATGFVTFSRESPSTQDIRIPALTQVSASGDITLDAAADLLYETTFEVVLTAGQLSVVAPVRAILPGASYNLAANRISGFGGSPIFGIHTVTNETAITGGMDAESDDDLKVRFKNTVFRNLAGTSDQFMALAASALFTTRANVVGPISRYREYLQVPPVSDAEGYDVNPLGTPEGGGEAHNPLEFGHGNPGEYTTALSTVPYSKHTYGVVPSFITNGQTGAQAIFYREDVDWRLNLTTAFKNRGDAYRFFNSDVSDPDLVLGVDPGSQEATYKPNVTFFNVYTGSSPDVTAIRPNGMVLFEHSYMSTASRNNWERNVTNCVDVYIDGENLSVASTVIPGPGVAMRTAFSNEPRSKFYRWNYRRAGQPDTPPTLKHLHIPLFFEPVIDLPDFIQIDQDDMHAVFMKNVHYWLVEDVSDLHGSVRARNGIEWDQYKVGWQDATMDGEAIPVAWALRDFAPQTSIPIENYTFDKNIIDLQSVYESNKQVTTDILVHRARVRWLKLDVTVTFNQGYNTDDTNGSMRDALARYTYRQGFGSVVQLSDLLQVIHGVPGVDNVRWSSDIPGADDLDRVHDCTSDGETRDDLGEGMDITGWYPGPDLSLVGLAADITADNNSVMTLEPLTVEPADLYAGYKYNVIGGYVYAVRAKVRSRGAQGQARIDWRWYDGTWGDWLRGSQFVSPDGDVWNEGQQTGLVAPKDATKLELRITFLDTIDMQDIDRVAILIGPNENTRVVDYILKTEQLVYNSDFFLLDDELPRLCEGISPDDNEDAVNRVFSVLPGLIVRTRAQNTWTRSF
jgi:uncharacterized phage protein gp47/JayE